MGTRDAVGGCASRLQQFVNFPLSRSCAVSTNFCVRPFSFGYAGCSARDPHHQSGALPQPTRGVLPFSTSDAAAPVVGCCHRPTST